MNVISVALFSSAIYQFLYQDFSVQLLNRVQIFVTLWTAASQAFLSFTASWSLLEFMSAELVRLCNHLIICGSLLPLPSIFPSSGSFQVYQLFASGGQSIGASASASVLPMKIQSWFPLKMSGLSSLLSKGLSRVLSNTTVQKHQLYIIDFL